MCQCYRDLVDKVTAFIDVVNKEKCLYCGSVRKNEVIDEYDIVTVDSIDHSKDCPFISLESGNSECWCDWGEDL